MAAQKSRRNQAKRRALSKEAAPSTTPVAASSTGAPSSTTVVDVRTEGQRLLLAVPGSHAEVAAAVDGSKQAVSYWRRGEKTPGATARGRLRDAFGIDPGAWDRKPITSPATAPAASPAPAPPSPPIETQPAAAAAGSKLSTLEEVETQIAELRKLQGENGLLASERVRLADSMGKLLAIKARLERDNELLEDRVVRKHPFWARVKGAILDALRAHPAAARDVAEALARAEGG